MASPQFASGPMSVDHIPGRSIVLGLAGYELACSGCSFEFGKADQEGKRKEFLDIIFKGLHVENRKVLERPDIKPLSTPLSNFDWGVVPGRSINIKSSPDSGFNVVCPQCAYNLGKENSVAYTNMLAQGNHINHSNPPAKEDHTKEKDGSPTPAKEDNTEEDGSATTDNKDDETTKGNEVETGADDKRTTAVMGNDGVAGITIKGGEIEIEIAAPATNPTTKSTVTLIAPTNADDVVANNYGVAGINIKGTGKVKFVIGKATK